MKTHNKFYIKLKIKDNKNESNSFNQLAEENKEIILKISKEKTLEFYTNLLCETVKKHPDYQTIIKQVQIGRDGLLGSLRRIQWAYNSKNLEIYEYDELEIKNLVFFQNVKALLDIVSKNNPKIELYKDLIKASTYIRNMFAHFYEKNFNTEIKFIRINKNNQFNKGLIGIEIFNFETCQ